MHRSSRLALFLIVTLAAACDGNGSSLFTTTTVGAPGGSTTTLVTMLTSTTSTTTTTTTSMGPPPVETSGVIEISVTSSGTLGALQFDVDYSAIDGSFDGVADSVDCTSPLTAGGGLITFNDEDGSKRLRIGVISLSGFNTPVVAAECVFTANGDSFPAPAEFDVVVIDASAPDFTAVAATMAVTAATPF